jgi:CubicO group peptidase (beta-lactamase class C family)
VWETAEPADAGFDRKRLVEAGEFLARRSGGNPYRALVVRRGRIAAEWNFRVRPDEKRSMGAAADAVYSCLTGVAVSEGVLGSADDKVSGLYPEMLDVPPGRGPAGTAWAAPKDREITFRQVLCHTSGYLAPGEQPGTVFRHNPCAMAVLGHALAAAYNLYKTGDPLHGAGIGKLAEWRLRQPIGARWTWDYSDLGLPSSAAQGVIGYHADFKMDTRDMARLGLLWARGGMWNGKQVVPAAWLAEASTSQLPGVQGRLAGQDESVKCVLGFWKPSGRNLWPRAPADTFAALGYEGQQVWVSPALDLVMAANPGLDRSDSEELFAHVAAAAGAA